MNVPFPNFNPNIAKLMKDHGIIFNTFHHLSPCKQKLKKLYKNHIQFVFEVLRSHIITNKRIVKIKKFELKKVRVTDI